MDAELTCLGVECESLDSYDVTYVEEFLPHCVVHSLVLSRADFVSLYIDLDASAFVLKFTERSSAHNASAHNASGDAHFLEIAFLRVELRSYLCGICVYRILCCRIGLYPQFL